MSKSYLFDAWAFLALLQKEEPAASRVRKLLQEGLDRKVDLFISIINIGEIYYRIGKEKGRNEAEATLKNI